MKIIKQTIIRQTTRRRIVSKTIAEKIYAVCPQCRVVREMMPAAETAQLLGLGERRIFSLVEAGEFHIFETGGGRLFICCDSIENLNQEDI